MHIMWSIIHDVPRTNPYIAAHDHPYDELLFFQGFNPDEHARPRRGVRAHARGPVPWIDSTCAIYIPAGMKHNPLTVISVERPCGLAAISADGLYRTEGYITANHGTAVGGHDAA